MTVPGDARLLGERLLAARERRGVSQATAAGEIGVSRRALQYIEAGEGRRLNLATLRAIEAWLAQDEATA